MKVSKVKENLDVLTRSLIAGSKVDPCLMLKFTILLALVKNNSIRSSPLTSSVKESIRQEDGSTHLMFLALVLETAILTKI